MMKTKRSNHPLSSLWVGIPLWSIAVVLSMVFSDCSGDSRRRAAAPLPPAYPRLPIYDTVHTAVAEAAPLAFYANASATITVPGRGDGKGKWINVNYPLYKAVMYCTITHVSDTDRDRVIDNRAERMSLNTGGHPTEITTIESDGGFHGQMLVTRGESVTPIQFLSTDGREWVVSGAVYLESMPRSAAIDSIAPVIDALRDDAVYLLTRLDDKRQ